MEGTSETGECVPAPSKKRLKRIAAKKLKREAKRAKYEELSSVPGPSTISERELAETTVFIKEGLRFVKSYSYTFNVFVKQRWIGKSVLDVLTQEYRGMTVEHYKEEIRRGLVQINDQMISFTRKFEANECMQHRMHRHEPPVTGEKIKVVYSDEMVVVVDKPASIPVHPTGRYRHNTVMFLLAHDYHISNLYPVHRLDKLTSGLLVFARNSQRADKIASEIRSDKVTKTYLARVLGEFPPDKVVCKDPILLSTDIGMKELNKVHPDGKPCETHFERISFDGLHSIVKCLPKTGRTHQIRVHLAHLGFPIVNDPLYNEDYRNKFAEPWEISMGNQPSSSSDDAEDGNDGLISIEQRVDSSGKGMDAPSNKSTQPFNESSQSPNKSRLPLNESSQPSDQKKNQDQKNLNQPASVPPSSSPSISNNTASPFSTTPNTSSSAATASSTPPDSSANASPPSDSLLPTPPSHDSDDSFDPSSIPYIPIEDADPKPLCQLCSVVWRLPKPHQLCIFLHALSYQSEHFYYETDPPAWSLESYQYVEPDPPSLPPHAPLCSSASSPFL